MAPTGVVAIKLKEPCTTPRKFIHKKPLTLSQNGLGKYSPILENLKEPFYRSL